MTHRIAISMRVVQFDHGELRDALAQDWGRFLHAVLPDCFWVPVPNIGEAAVAMAHELGLTGLILTGGDDWGVHPQRDHTEECLFHWATKHTLPILGVCRGMQTLVRLFGGTLVPIAQHVATRHAVRFISGQQVTVNSFHASGIAHLNPDTPLQALAICEDGSIEAVHHLSLPIRGVLWHPEREQSPAEHDKLLLQQLFGR